MDLTPEGITKRIKNFDSQSASMDANDYVRLSSVKAVLEMVIPLLYHKGDIDLGV